MSGALTIATRRSDSYLREIVEAGRHGGRLHEIVLIPAGLLSCSFLMEVIEVTWSRLKFLITSVRDSPQPFTAVSLSLKMEKHPLKKICFY